MQGFTVQHQQQTEQQGSFHSAASSAKHDDSRQQGQPVRLTEGALKHQNLHGNIGEVDARTFVRATLDANARVLPDPPQYAEGRET